MSTATASQSKAFSSSPYKGITFSYSGGPITCNRAVKDREEWLKTNQWDTISATRHVPLHVKYVVVDVETHDWNAFDYNDRSKSRIVVLSISRLWARGNSPIIASSSTIAPHKAFSNQSVNVLDKVLAIRHSDLALRHCLRTSLYWESVDIKWE